MKFHGQRQLTILSDFIWCRKLWIFHKYHSVVSARKYNEKSVNNDFFHIKISNSICSYCEWFTPHRASCCLLGDRAIIALTYAIVFTAMDNICDIVECLNNGICLDWGGRYFCSCKGDYYGHLCQNRKFWIYCISFK